MRRVDYTRQAREDLTGIRRWLRQPGSGEGARQRYLAITAAIRGLRHAPCRAPRGDTPGTRELTVRAHVAVYEVDPDTGDNATAGDVLVLRVFGPGQRRSL